MAMYTLKYKKDERQPDGTIKTRWCDLGVAFSGKQGNFVLKFNSMPVGDWDGSVGMFPVDQDETFFPAKPRQGKEKREERVDPSWGPDDDLPF